MRIGVFFGGKNTEHDVSIITGQLIISGLKELGHEVVPVYLSKQGKWFIDERMASLDFFKSLDSKRILDNLSPANLELAEGANTIVKSGLFSKKLFSIDMAFPAFHGMNGEDGTIQGLFELLNIPYVGCDVASSAMTIDKVLTKLMYQRFNIPTPQFIYFTKKEWTDGGKEIMSKVKNQLRFPLFIKPSRLGSSIGISKAKNEEELEFAIEVALHYDDKILVEEGVENMVDLTVCLIGNEEPIISEIQESAFSQDFFSYEDKYISDGGAQLGNAKKKFIIPARLDEKTTQEIKDTAKEVYKIMGCSGISRVDFLYDSKFKKYYVNEVNTLPGTIYHHLWKESGIDLKSLLTKLIDYGKEKHAKKQKLNYTFDSEILKQSSSTKLKLKGGA